MRTSVSLEQVVEALADPAEDERDADTPVAKLFDQFCKKMLLNPNIKKQVHSLYLSNDLKIDQIEAFLSYFSFDEFPHLRSLTLILLEANTMEKIKSIR